MGGKATRLDGMDKAGLMMGERGCFEHVYGALSQDIKMIAVSLAQGGAPTTSSELPQIRDIPSPQANGGVAFAILACLEWAKAEGLEFIITSPVDTPFLPKDFAARMMSAYQKSDMLSPIVSQCVGNIHSLHALWPSRCLDDLRAYVLKYNIYKMRELHLRLKSERCEFVCASYDPFMNINTAEAIATARNLLELIPSIES